MATVIDSLMVTLGLDPNPFKKAALEAERQQKRLKDSTKKSGGEIGDALKAVGTEAAALVLGFEGIKGALTWFAGLNVASANLGRLSANLGQNAHEVNAWDNAVELAGGSAKAAQADLLGLSNSLTALRATGEVSPLVLLLQRMGVATFDAQGKTRKLADIYKDLGDRLKQYNRADAFNLGKQAGLSEDTLNLLLMERHARDDILATAERNNAVNEESVAQAAELQKEWRDIGQQVTAVGQRILSAVTPAVKSVFSAVGDLYGQLKQNAVVKDFIDIFSGGLRAIWDLLKFIWKGWAGIFDLLTNNPVAHWLKGLLDKAAGLANEYDAAPSQTPAKAAPSAQDKRTLGLRNNNPGNLRFAGQAGAVEGEGGFAKFGSLAEGIQAANRQLDLFAKRGVNTIAQIVSKWAPTNENDTQGYIGRIEKQLGINRNQQLTAADRQRLLSAIFNQGEGNRVASGDIAAALGPNPRALDAARFASANAPGTGLLAQNTSHETNVQIDKIEVHTQATDANGVAADLPNAIRRKGIVAQADTGQS